MKKSQGAAAALVQMVEGICYKLGIAQARAVEAGARGGPRADGRGHLRQTTGTLVKPAPSPSKKPPGGRGKGGSGRTPGPPSRRFPLPRMKPHCDLGSLDLRGTPRERHLRMWTARASSLSGWRRRPGRMEPRLLPRADRIRGRHDARPENHVRWAPCVSAEVLQRVWWAGDGNDRDQLCRRSAPHVVERADVSAPTKTARLVRVRASEAG